MAFSGENEGGSDQGIEMSVDSANSSILPIGGFFSLAIDDIPPVDDSVWSEWTRHYSEVSKFGTARTAMIALIAALLPRRVWLPAYFCGEVVTAISAATTRLGVEIHTFGLNHDLEPDIPSLSSRIGAGDLVIVVDYFGSPPSQKFRDFARDRTDVVWVEDRAQTLWTADAPWGTWCLFSPRKLLGVAHGGLLLGDRAISLPGGGLSDRTDLAVALPELMRYEDQIERQNDLWYAAYKAREDGLDGSGSISRLAEALLHRIPIGPLVRARQVNCSYLLERLGHLAAWPRTPTNIAPFGLPILVQDSSLISRKLAEERLFCPRHWPTLGASRSLFPYEHRLSRQLLTLPCDHRYTVEELSRLADTVLRFVPNSTSAKLEPNEKNYRIDA